MPYTLSVPPFQRTIALLFIDLDGTLLDCQSYRTSEAALAEVRKLEEVGVGMIPATSKTAAETAGLAAMVGLGRLAIAECGGVIVNAEGSTEIFGSSRSDLVEVLEELQRRGWPIRGMSQMTAAEVVHRTGLDPAAAEQAMDRVASEPFVFTKPSSAPVEELVRQSASLGADVERGGRFRHLLGRGVSKGSAVGRILESATVQREGLTAAVGDAWNDLSMLARVNHGFLLGTAVPDDVIPAGVIRLVEDGPAGFVLAARHVLRLLASRIEGRRG